MTSFVAYIHPTLDYAEKIYALMDLLNPISLFTVVFLLSCCYVHFSDHLLMGGNFFVAVLHILGFCKDSNPKFVESSFDAQWIIQQKDQF